MNALSLAAERRHRPAGHTDFMLALVFLFSLAGLVLWALPFDTERRALSHGVTPALVATFSAMTLLSGTAMLLSRRRQRLFDRRK
jgi:hypothetical protein